ncbi:hypothetical protein C8Q78DRAFT_1020955 [Trametes maxima]|nr:hypothetical protein C8Q78DRAFT_1020955 [Trametes maxima]
MMLAEVQALRGQQSVCTRWWMEETRRAAQEPAVCGDDAEVVPEFYAWLSEEELRALDELQERARRGPGAAAGGEGETVASASSGGAGSSGEGQSLEAAEREREERWLERERVLDVLGAVAGAGVAHAHGVSPEERARRATDPEFYADWPEEASELVTDRAPIWPQWQPACVDIVMGPRAN